MSNVSRGLRTLLTTIALSGFFLACGAEKTDGGNNTGDKPIANTASVSFDVTDPAQTDPLQATVSKKAVDLESSDPAVAFCLYSKAGVLQIDIQEKLATGELLGLRADIAGFDPAKPTTGTVSQNIFTVSYETTPTPATGPKNTLLSYVANTSQCTINIKGETNKASGDFTCTGLTVSGGTTSLNAKGQFSCTAYSSD